MFRTIVVPLDGSPFAERALPYARVLARAERSRLALIEAVPPASVASTRTGADVDKAMGDAQEYLGTIEPGVAAQEGIETAAYYGEAAETILQEAAARAADLIVMSTHGRSGLGRWIYGSVAERVFQHARVPVLVIPAGCARQWTAGARFRVLVALDGSALAEGVLGPTLELAGALHAELTLVRAVGAPSYAAVPGYADAGGPVVQLSPMGSFGVAQLPSYSDATTRYVEIDNRESAEIYLRPIVDSLASRGFKTTLAVESGPPDLVITGLARDQGYDAIAMATRGHGGLARVALGSTAIGVLRQASVPVFLVPAPVAHAAGAWPRVTSATA